MDYTAGLILACLLLVHLGGVLFFWLFPLSHRLPSQCLSHIFLSWHVELILLLIIYKQGLVCVTNRVRYAAPGCFCETFVELVVGVLPELGLQKISVIAPVRLRNFDLFVCLVVCRIFIDRHIVERNRDLGTLCHFVLKTFIGEVRDASLFLTWAPIGLFSFTFPLVFIYFLLVAEFSLLLFQNLAV